VAEERPAEGRRRVHPLVRVFVWLGLLSAVGAFIVIPGLVSSSRASNDRNAWASLRTLVSAQQDFRVNDRDGNGKADFWRADVAGLYALAPSGPGSEIKLIEISIAGADAAPVVSAAAFTMKAPKAGYWYKALSFADEDPARPDPNRFAACAYPTTAAAGRTAFLIDHRGVVYRRRWNGPSDTPLLFPADPRKEGWATAR